MLILWLTANNTQFGFGMEVLCEFGKVSFTGRWEPRPLEQQWWDIKMRIWILIILFILVNIFFLFVQVCPVGSAGSRCLLPSETSARVPRAAEAYTVEMRAGRCTLVAWYSSWEFLAWQSLGLFFSSRSVGSACDQILCNEYILSEYDWYSKEKKKCYLALHSRGKQATSFNNEHLFTCDYKQPCWCMPGKAFQLKLLGQRVQGMFFKSVWIQGLGIAM